MEMHKSLDNAVSFFKDEERASQCLRQQLNKISCVECEANKSANLPERHSQFATALNTLLSMGRGEHKLKLNSIP
jgi:hypothetical protein